MNQYSHRGKMMISQTTEYAIRAIIEMGQKPEGEYVLAKTLAEDLDIPHFYLGKILQQLVKSRVLKSTRGRNGGFSLAKPANKIRLRDVVEPFEDVDKSSECILGQDSCNDKVACPLHDYWKDVRERYVQELETKTVSDLADFGVRRKKATGKKKSGKKKSR